MEVADDVVELVGIDGFSGDADRGDGLEAALEHLLRLLTPTTGCCNQLLIISVSLSESPYDQHT